MNAVAVTPRAQAQNRSQTDNQGSPDLTTLIANISAPDNLVGALQPVQLQLFPATTGRRGIQAPSHFENNVYQGMHALAQGIGQNNATMERLTVSPAP